ncbi:restriction endonuclease [Peribacillus frigoritolerans]|uniref:restriction endonuclease n=1 Tax=Peribacillus frigoritolerans TaxID=450367 RepID=UPI002E1D63E6|nr:restriction endonuclease [Peribacillus frigoritolerans]MED3831936.1 restriction endonuclease [Peribacillus frigoritolerans]MED3845702.1 restriction endonuclease [Peribacillus frigoritolerans]
MALPSYDEIHLPLLKLILNNSVNRLKEAVEILAKEFGLTDEELNERVPSGGRKFYYQVSFSLMLLTRAGLIFKGIKPFRTTDSARKVIAQNPNKITKRCLDDLANDRQVKKIKKEKDLEEKRLLNSYNEYLQKLKGINETYFEHVTGLVLSRVYNIDFISNVEITPPNNDGGIDGIIHLGEGEESKVYFEAKRKKDRPIPSSFLRDFTGALVARKATTGYYVTTTRYTNEAIRFVEKLRDPYININITLIDGHKLVELIFKYNLENEVIPIKQ